MPNRILKESIRYSESIDQLGLFEEVVFYRLLTCCDDFGRMDARPAVLNAALFPLRKYTDARVARAVCRLEEVGVLLVYSVAGYPYLQLRNWARHQTVRAKRSKYPSPTGEREGRDAKEGESAPCTADAAACGRVEADAPIAAPTFGEVYRFFSGKRIDTAFHETNLFLAYNAKRGWDCLPDWRAAAELWALRRLERSLKGNGGGLACEE